MHRRSPTACLITYYGRLHHAAHKKIYAQVGIRIFLRSPARRLSEPEVSNLGAAKPACLSTSAPEPNLCGLAPTEPRAAAAARHAGRGGALDTSRTSTGNLLAGVLYSPGCETWCISQGFPLAGVLYLSPGWRVVFSLRMAALRPRNAGPPTSLCTFAFSTHFNSPGGS